MIALASSLRRCYIYSNCCGVFSVFFYKGYGDHRELHGLTHSFPTRRSADLPVVTKCALGNFATSKKSEPGSALSRSLRSEEHTSELQSPMRISYAVLCSKKKNNKYQAHLKTYHSINRIQQQLQAIR